ncbi:hypothetical protein BDZ97DRAFT_1709352 [Flammula alnicola]|nr:hypothetical protein BDZ97DRAFT_1709352 [Flammula alnicola]
MYLPAKITGASSGLGNALAHAVLESGRRLIATLRDPSKLADFQKQYPSSQLQVVRLDVMVQSDIDAAFELSKSHFKRLDYVVNNLASSERLK